MKPINNMTDTKKIILFAFIISVCLTMAILF